MKKIAKEQRDERNQLIATLETRRNELNDKISHFNEQLHQNLEDVKQAHSEVNEALAALKEWRDAVVGDMDNYYDEKSENWQEGDRGQSYTAWKETYENLDIEEELDLTLPDEIEEPTDLDQLIEDINELPEEPEDA